VLLVKFNDIGAYTIGMLFGKRKLIPEISPKKSVEGLFGGYLFSIIVSLIVWGIAKKLNNGWVGCLPFHFANAIILPILLTTFGVIGDLAESLIKRSVNVKDSSSRFPGMGGILDIMDSLLFAAPVMYLYLLVFMKH
jgi:phosphatidate cytidylyltransferase